MPPVDTIISLPRFLQLHAAYLINDFKHMFGIYPTLMWTVLTSTALNALTLSCIWCIWWMVRPPAPSTLLFGSLLLLRGDSTLSSSECPPVVSPCFLTRWRRSSTGNRNDSWQCEHLCFLEPAQWCRSL